MKKTLQRFQPGRAWADLRYFLTRRQPHQWVFFTLAVGLTVLALLAFVHDSDFKPAYHRDIVYVQQWRADRTDAQIIAQQKIDGPKDAARKAAEAERLERNRRFFQGVKDKTDKWM